MSELREFLAEQSLSQAPRAAEFARIVQALDLFIPEALQGDLVDRLREAMLAQDWDAWEVTLDAVCEGHDLVFNRRWRFHDRRSLRVMLDEIMVREEYFIPPPLPAVPVFIDCGANIGLATYFVKRRHPTARIIAFEPNPAMFACLEVNVGRSAFSDVQLHQAAVGGSVRQDMFQTRSDASMAGRLGGTDMGGSGIRVGVVPLSAILEAEPEIDLLKVDIEGAEAEALPEASNLLRRCRFIFVECHMAAREPAGGTLLPVLNALAEQGFAFHVGRTAWSERQHSFRPLRHAHQASSSCVFATRLD
ncbi:FkbM family methyltransferase [Humitalea rosea]|uniref:FkbM family methyltransferase n=1 Tax=Humitalea rosea TaxID=990373 RepID=A0A2W7HTK2_9PROT|nr:FkbM family methyltransferase [Humitalea rosea]PZW37014.1 FkbM family methyltransferase [Humitalea rosea]